MVFQTKPSTLLLTKKLKINNKNNDSDDSNNNNKSNSNTKKTNKEKMSEDLKEERQKVIEFYRMNKKGRLNNNNAFT